MTSLPTRERVKDILHYDPETGTFTWRVAASNRVKAGDVAGAPDGDGYVKINIDWHSYRAHRVAWLYMTGRWPKAQIDHINCVPDDNRFANLREATVAENARNRRRPKSALPAPKGVCFAKDTQRWQASIQGAYIGQFDSPEEAHAAYCSEASRRFGAFARFD